MRTWALAIGLTVTTAACSRSSLRLPTAGATTGAGGDASTSSATTATTADVGATSSTGGPMCGIVTQDFVQIALQVFQGPLVGCLSGAQPPSGTSTHSVTGVVLKASGGSFTIDSCPPNSDCAGQFLSLIHI